MSYCLDLAAEQAVEEVRNESGVESAGLIPRLSLGRLLADQRELGLEIRLESTAGVAVAVGCHIAQASVQQQRSELDWPAN